MDEAHSQKKIPDKAEHRRDDNAVLVSSSVPAGKHSVYARSDKQEHEMGS